MSATAISLEVGIKTGTQSETQEETSKRPGIHTSKGRTGSLAFCSRSAIALLMMTACAVAMIAAGSNAEQDRANLTVVHAATMFLALIGIAYSLWLSVVTGVKRLHDIGRSGWYYLICMLPVAGSLYYLYIAVKRSDTQDNRFGTRLPPNAFEKFTGVPGFVILALFIAASFVEQFASLAS